MTQKKERHKILINAVDPEECRIALVKGNCLESFHIETTAGQITRGNIYKGLVTRVEQSLQAVFVDYGAERHGFLQQHEIHSDYYSIEKPPAGKKGTIGIRDLIKPGQELLVQVTKEPILHKGAMLTTFISLPGRYVVLMPGGKSSGISRKIEDEKERQRLKDIMDSLKIPEGFGTILRTAAQNQKKQEISKDVRYLLRLWKNIKKQGVSTPAPCLLYKERHVAIRAIRDHFTSEVNEILIDNKDIFQDVKYFIRIISPRHTRIVKHYKDPEPLFTRYEIEDQIGSIFASRVPLKSGGHIVINPTEALVAIDVNSGKARREGSMEGTAYATNIEAAGEIARQLRLRDLGGLVVIDFIDMRERKHNLAVERAMKEHTKLDKARVNIGKISKFGLMELARQRIAASIEFGSFMPCPHCQGKGMVPSAERLALEFLRRLRSETLKENITQVKGIVPSNVADYLLNKKRKEILDLEMRRNLTITIEGDLTIQPGENRIICE
ncbi:MAG: Rne/Rng family ribonuclease [Deltaproteobacteria bacterium]|nr:Rne/Rng family ribonuclease [Deltaproteobacteria bacterium]MBW2019690.1 Rne/Rng family ribonuclease [Deltaproteobacteria bacterium]MBW2074470.1 Rne/Rng family ribonuclease [Deltaproteobacteria bacterium]RLB81687.1 MAG: ribonuclease [Deltaproteobacteria bacterium]